jgi:hypothetical protein
MHVFISWSGDLSKHLGDAFRRWLPGALQFVKPYFTPSDLDKGARWASEISVELSKSEICIIILKRSNLDSRWIMFEAGAISKVIDKTRVCPVIFGVEPTDVEGPLAQFQATKFAKDDVRKLFTTINSLAGEHKLEDYTAETVFEKWWLDLESDVASIMEQDTNSMASKPKGDLRSEKDLLEETLLLMRTLANRQQALEGHVEAIREAISNVNVTTSAISYAPGLLQVSKTLGSGGKIVTPNHDGESSTMSSRLEQALKGGVAEQAPKNARDKDDR